MKEVLAKYKNGNYTVILLNDGTKIRYNNLDNLTPSFAESMDITITECCNGNCNFCYLGCTESGKHADLNQPLFDTLHKGTEIALNGNDLSHPDLFSFLRRMTLEKGVICNLTVNQKHFMENIDFLMQLSHYNLIKGLGISLNNSKDPEFYKAIKKFPNAVIHTIDGLLTKEDLDNMSNKNIKLLILGYKILGRGDTYYKKNKDKINANIDWLNNHLMEYTDKFTVISFDNLAISHLHLKEKISEETWNSSYMGDEGAFTLYIDSVNHKFAISSLDKTKYDYTDDMTVDDMFKFIQGVIK